MNVWYWPQHTTTRKPAHQSDGGEVDVGTYIQLAVRFSSFFPTSRADLFSTITGFAPIHYRTYDMASVLHTPLWEEKTGTASLDA